MIINIDTNLASGTTFVIALGGTTSINWGDGTIDSLKSHTYASNGTYTIEILSSTSTDIAFSVSTGRGFLTSISSWGSIAWTSISFFRQLNLTSVPNTLPTTVTSTAQMFYRCTSFNSSNVSSWNTANVTNMQQMFAECTSFNQPLSGWNTSNVTSMAGMFNLATSFNQNINSWNVSNVTLFGDTEPLTNVGSAGGMFSGATAFNQPLNNWNTSSATNMSGMFRQATAFNRPLDNWDTSNVINMSGMFSGNFTFSIQHNFNQNISNWDTSNVVDMGSMFYYSEFNQPIGAWDVGNVVRMSAGGVPVWFGMFEEATSFNQNLNEWDISSLEDANNLFKNASSFSSGNVQDWNTAGIDIEDWLEGTITGPPVGVVTQVRIAVARETSNNRARITVTPTGTFYSYLLYYRIPDINSSWILFKTTTKLVDYHTNVDGYFSHSRIEYKAIGQASPFAPPVTESNVVTLTGGKIVRYVSGTKPGFRVKRIIHNETGNGLSVEFELPRPNLGIPISLGLLKNPVKYFAYRITDIKTGRALGSTLKDGKIIVEGANIINTSAGHRFAETFPKFIQVSNRVSITNGTQVINVGSKGLKLEWGWADKNGTVFVKDPNNYGLLYFYPKFVASPPPDNSTKPSPEPTDPVVVGPGDDELPEETPSFCIYNPLDPTEKVCIEAGTEDTVCIVETKDGIELSICTPLPAGAEPGQLNIRRDNDYITIIFEGEIIVTYKIDPVKFPNLVNSQGWWGYFDPETSEFTQTYEGLVEDFPTTDTGLYILQARYVDRPLANKSPFIYGSKLQAETVYVDKNGVVRIEEPVLAQELVDAQKVFENGLAFEIDTETAQQIWNAGGSQYITAVGDPILEEPETVIDVPEDQVEGEE